MKRYATLVAVLWVVSTSWAVAEPVYTIYSGGDSEGTARFVDDLTHLWQGGNPDEGSILIGRVAPSASARLNALRRMRGHFAVVDADILARHRAEYPDIVTVALLWPETLHIFARRGDTAALAALPAGDLLVAESATYGQVALAGVLGSGSPTTKWLLLTGGGLTAALQRTPLPLLLASGVAPLPEVEQALRGGSDVRLISIARPQADQIRGQYPWLVAVTLPANTYPGQTLPVETLGVSQVLVTRADASGQLVRQALAALFRWQDRMAAVSARFGAIDRKANTAAAAWLPYHPAAQKEFGLAPPVPPSR